MILRSYQTMAIAAILESLKVHDKVGAVLPTGSGKSLIANEVIDQYARELHFNECVMICCHISDVVSQLHGMYEQYGQYGKQSMVLTSSDRPRLSTRVIFTTIQQLLTTRERKFWCDNPMKKEVKLVVIDEAHFVGTESYHIMCHGMFPMAKYVALSATPFRKNQFSFGQFDHVAYSISAKALIKDGFLVAPKLFQLSVKGMDKSERFVACIKIWHEVERQRQLPTVVYLTTVAEAQEMRLVCEEAGISCELVTGKTEEEEWRRIRHRLKTGALDMVLNVKKLDAGIDIPNIGAVMMPFGTKSVVTYLQRIGRALRPYPGKHEAHIYVCGDAPSIAEGYWSRIHDVALAASESLSPVEKLQDELVDLQEESAPLPRIAWTKAAIKACLILQKADMPGVAELIAEHRFPEKYARAIERLVAQMPRMPGGLGKKPVEAQIAILRDRHKFRQRDLGKLDYREAEAILLGLEKHYSMPHVLQSGPFAGVHISETPPLYRRHIRDVENRLLWQRWIKAGRPKTEETT